MQSSGVARACDMTEAHLNFAVIDTSYSLNVLYNARSNFRLRR